MNKKKKKYICLRCGHVCKSGYRLLNHIERAHLDNQSVFDDVDVRGWKLPELTVKDWRAWDLEFQAAQIKAAREYLMKEGFL